MSTQGAPSTQGDLVPEQEAHLSEMEEEEAEEEVGGKSPRASWEGSEVSSEEIEWLYNSRRIPRSVACRRPGSELSPEPQSGRPNPCSKCERNTTYSPLCSSGDNSEPGLRHSTALGIRRLLYSHSISAEETSEPSQWALGGLPPASSSASSSSSSEKRASCVGTRSEEPRLNSSHITRSRMPSSA